MYRSGFILSGMDTDSQMVSFSNGTQIFQGAEHSQLKEDVQKCRFAALLASICKEKKLRPLGIKVLSLFFIDKVDNYRPSAQSPTGKICKMV